MDRATRTIHNARSLSVPAPARNVDRDYKEEALLSLIPDDDGELKRAAIAHFLADEKWWAAFPSSPTREADDARRLELRDELTKVRARTPGGLAWRLQELLGVMEGEDDASEWQVDTLRAALADAVELERARELAWETPAIAAE